MTTDILETYLVHSCIYYAMDDNIISDHEFDQLCLMIRKGWRSIKSPYKQFVLDYEKGDASRMKGQSMLIDQYPAGIVSEAAKLLRERAA